MTALGDLLRDRIRELNLPSERALARHFGMSTATLNRIMNDVGVIAEETLRLLSAKLRMPITEIRTLADLPAGEEDPFKVEIPAEFDRLSADERNLLQSTLLAIGKQLLLARSAPAGRSDAATEATAHEASGGSVTELRQPEGRQRVTQAARRRPPGDPSEP